uniref:Putative secreted protein n=1 Tax=Anopheles darlingi TaxID=43151 RepID=A0A2M4DLL5_ANODA
MLIPPFAHDALVVLVMVVATNATIILTTRKASSNPYLPLPLEGDFPLFVVVFGEEVPDPTVPRALNIIFHPHAVKRCVSVCVCLSP